MPQFCSVNACFYFQNGVLRHRLLCQDDSIIDYRLVNSQRFVRHSTAPGSMHVASSGLDVYSAQVGDVTLYVSVHELFCVTSEEVKRD